MVLKSIAFTFFVAIAVITAHAGEPSAQDFAGRDSMNGISLKDYQGFERNWHFVTVRYRKDTGEMRLTYANDVAWKALELNQIDFPEGAVFAKIGIATRDDPAFASSAVPSGARRYQFMVRDKKKYRDTDGWGYALFDPNGRTFAEEPAKVVAACAACHHIVPERGYVFSQIMTGAPFALHDPDKLDLSVHERFVFKSENFADLPKAVQALLPLKTKTVRLLQGDLRDKLFQGTLDEIRPVLAAEVVASGQPALLLSRDGTRYSLVQTGSDATACGSGLLSVRGITNISFKENEKYEAHFCQPKS